MKFSDLLGEPEPEPGDELPVDEAAPISVFAPAPVAPPPVPDPPLPPVGSAADATTELPAPGHTPTPSGLLAGGRSGLAELNVRQPGTDAAPASDASVLDQLTGLDEIVDDLLPSRRGRK
ncbi:MAG: hypothetical protein ACXV8R_15085 [Acidimicrobiia bacterium]